MPLGVLWLPVLTSVCSSVKWVSIGKISLVGGLGTRRFLSMFTRHKVSGFSSYGADTRVGGDRLGTVNERFISGTGDFRNDSEARREDWDIQSLRLIREAVGGGDSGRSPLTPENRMGGCGDAQ